MSKQMSKLAAMLISVGSMLAAADSPAPKPAPAGQEKKEDQKETKRDPKKIGEITVVVTADAEVLEHVHSRVTAETIESLNATNLSEALALLPGLNFMMNSRGEMQIYVRGNEPRRVPVFLDGIPSYAPYRGDMDFLHFSVFDLEEIQVAKGFSSVLYGPNTLGGAINLVTKKPSEKIEGNAIVGATDANGKKAAVNIGSNLDRFYVQAGGSLRERGDFIMSSNFVPTAREDGDRRDNSDYKDTKISAKIGFTPNTNNEYVISYMLQTGEKGSPIATEGRASQRDHWRWPQWDKDSIYFLSHTGLGSNSYIKFRAYHDTHKNTLNMYLDNTYTELRPASPSKYDDFTNGALLEFGTTIFTGHSIRAVAQIKRDINRRWDPGLPWRHYKDELSSIGIEDSIKVNEKLDVTVGLAMDRQNPLETGEYEAKAAQTFVQGQFGAFWKATDKLHTYVTVARKNRFPTLADRFSQRMDRYIENPDLGPEDSMNYDIGVKANLASWITVEGALFYSDINDLIEEVANVQGNYSQMQNIGKVKHSGVELSFYLKPVSWAEAGIFYTYLHRENVSNPELQLRGIPKNRLTGYARITPFTQCYLMVSVESQTGIWQQDTSSAAVFLGGYTTANLTVGYKPTSAIVVDGGFTNILDRNYQNVIYYPSPGRTWFVNARYKF